MGGDQQRVGPAGEKAVEPGQRVEVEVVGRLVHEQEVRLGEQRLGEGETAALAAAELRHGLAPLVLGEAEAHEHLGQARAVVVAGAAGLEAVVQRRIALLRALDAGAEVVRRFGKVAFEVDQVVEGRKRFFLNRRAAGRLGRDLLHQGDAGVPRDVATARGWRHLAGQHLQQRRLAGAVASDQADAVAVVELAGDAADHVLGAEGNLDVLQCDYGHNGS